MDISKIMTPAEKQVDISEFGTDGDFITVRLIPARIRTSIDLARTKGLNLSVVSEILKKNPTLDLKDEKVALKIIGENGNIIGEGYDNGFEANVLTLLCGVDEKKHTFENNGKACKLDRTFWVKLADNPATEGLVAFITKAVTEYQEEMRLGEGNARK